MTKETFNKTVSTHIDKINTNKSFFIIEIFKPTILKLEELHLNKPEMPFLMTKTTKTPYWMECSTQESMMYNFSTWTKHFPLVKTNNNSHLIRIISLTMSKSRCLWSIKRAVIMSIRLNKIIQCIIKIWVFPLIKNSKVKWIKIIIMKNSITTIRITMKWTKMECRTISTGRMRRLNNQTAR